MFGTMTKKSCTINQSFKADDFRISYFELDGFRYHLNDVRLEGCLCSKHFHQLQQKNGRI